jgi:hypothetical protein
LMKYCKNLVNCVTFDGCANTANCAKTKWNGTYECIREYFCVHSYIRTPAKDKLALVGHISYQFLSYINSWMYINKFGRDVHAFDLTACNEIHTKKKVRPPRKFSKKLKINTGKNCWKFLQR